MSAPDFILITRPAADAASLAAAVEAAGFQALCAPLLTVRLFPENVPDLTAAQAVVFTSANAVRAVGAVDCALPVYAVGERTAAAARVAGFHSVIAADGDAVSLNALLARAGLRPGKPVFHLSGRDIAAEIVVPGVETVRYVVYQADKIEKFDETVAAHLRAGRVAAVILLSARTGEALAAALRAAGLEGAAAGIRLLSLSDSVLKSVAHLPWREVAVADRPNLENICALVAGAAL